MIHLAVTTVPSKSAIFLYITIRIMNVVVSSFGQYLVTTTTQDFVGLQRHLKILKLCLGGSGFGSVRIQGRSCEAQDLHVHWYDGGYREGPTILHDRSLLVISSGT